MIFPVRALFFILCLFACRISIHGSREPSSGEAILMDLGDWEQHYREELGANELSTPAVGAVFSDLEVFQPPPLDLIRSVN
jgi:hypothetical protein